MKTTQPLLTSFKMGDLELQNRIVMAPMTRSRADNPENAPTAMHELYYKQRASAGLIITEGSQVSKEAVGYINTPGIYSESQVAGWKKVVDAVHSEGGTVFIQLWHCGSMSHPDFHNGKPPLSASDVNPNEKSYTPEGFKDTVAPKPMTSEDISRTIADFKQAAINAKKAGFDGVEIHSSNGYLFHQFFNAHTNKRTDAYGGNIENRARLLFDVLDEIKTVYPENRIGVRLNPSLHGVFGMQADAETIPTFEYIITRLNDYDLAYLHLSEPFTDVSEVPFLVPNIAAHFRPLYKGTLMINNNFDREKGNKILNEGLADLVAYGKPFISNPDLPLRFEREAPLQEWDQNTFYVPGEKGYTDYPALEV
ncbi:alkene reductase [Arenibacter sp. GZD96]|uniref:alkene reductase n=1 Tax=Aurantibrevibacter litoralis TaxID=3106030 RepID=UPI002AFEC216|nr:alkene reductase [Arenibacter sp. GZD-96]MEA1784747.1 alkene reductase [Arenibacter sp. GZD-96]